MSNSKTLYRETAGQMLSLRSISAIGMALLLVPLVGCGSGSGIARNAQYQKLIQSHSSLSKSPAHSFRTVFIQKASPDFHIITWGDVSGDSWLFRVANLSSRPDIFPTTTPVDYEAIADTMAQYLDFEQAEWVASGNGDYSFSVKETDSDSDFLLIGLEEDPNEVVTPSCMPFGSMYDHCYLKNIEAQYEIEEIAASTDAAFPNSTAVRMNHRTKNFSKTLYFDEQQGRRIGERVFDPPSELQSQVILRYSDNERDSRLQAIEVYFPSSNGKLELARIHYFLSWELGERLEKNRCYLSYYGLPEPTVSSSNRRWSYFSIGCLAFVSLFILVAITRKRRNARNA